MIASTTQRRKLSDAEIARRLWRIYELALVAADRAEQQEPHPASERAPTLSKPTMAHVQP